LNIITVNFFNEIEGDGNTKEDNEENTEEKTHKNNGSVYETNNQQKTKNVLKSLINITDNVKVFTAKMAESIYNQFRKKKVNVVTKYRGPLILTPSLHLEVAVFTKTSKIEVPSLKKHSLVTEFSEDVKAGSISQERVYYINDDPEQSPLEEEFITKAYNYGSSLVPISKTDQVLFKNQEHKCIKAIGFTDSFRVPRNHFISGVDIITPVGGDATAFTAVVQSMIEMNKVLICRYVSRDNSEPKLVVLSPYMTKRGAVLYLNTLPTVEDIRDFQFESLTECSKKQEEVVSGFIDSLDLENVGEEEMEMLKPSETFNPILQYFYQCLEYKALGNQIKTEEDQEKAENTEHIEKNATNNFTNNQSNNKNSINTLPPLDDTISDYLRPDKLLFENNKWVSFLPKMFDIKDKKKEEKKKRVFWKDMINSEISASTGISEKKLEEKLEAHKEEAKKSISTTRPIEDFKEMLNYKYSDLTENAIEGMKLVIHKFISESFKGSYYIKALDCLKVLRDSCIDEDEVEKFNEFLHILKQEYPKEKYSDFWRLINDNRISLISKKENVKSFVSEEEAKEWLDSLNKKEVISATLNELDDLIADID
jgi:ATP-dependent DNA helicase 2 subunit 2